MLADHKDSHGRILPAWPRVVGTFIALLIIVWPLAT